MNLGITLWLGIAMAVFALVNASLMAWLWRFPLGADGQSTAPRGWVNLHRGIGYSFAVIYVVLLSEMVPRVWGYRGEPEVGAILHGILGALVGLILVGKILVIRLFKSLGGRLPWFGGALLLSTLAGTALTVPPAWRVHAPFVLAPVGAERLFALGRTTVGTKCGQCHGPSRIAGEREDSWAKTVAEMQENSVRIPGKLAITDAEREAAAYYLTVVLGSGGEGESGEDGVRHRGRGRD